MSDFESSPGKIRRYIIEGKEIGVVFWDGGIYAFTNECTHRGFPLHFSKVTDGEVFCLSHGALFQLPTGELVEGPVDTYEGLTMHDVEVVGDEIRIRLRAQIPEMP